VRGFHAAADKLFRRCIVEVYMTTFSVGDQVVIRYGIHEGKRARIITRREKDAYKVKAEDGYILFFSSKGLKLEAGKLGRVMD
jgi:hypothetical protein